MRLAALALLLLHAAAADGAASSDTDSSSAAPVTLAVTVNDTAVTAVLDDFYLGYNIDSGSLYHGIALSNPVFTQLARNLAPAQLRIGGTASDSLCAPARARARVHSRRPLGFQTLTRARGCTRTRLQLVRPGRTGRRDAGADAGPAYTQRGSSGGARVQRLRAPGTAPCIPPPLDS
jgi:hypothetical protein